MFFDMSVDDALKWFPVIPSGGISFAESRQMVVRAKSHKIILPPKSMKYKFETEISIL